MKFLVIQRFDFVFIRWESRNFVGEYGLSGYPYLCAVNKKGMHPMYYKL